MVPDHPSLRNKSVIKHIYEIYLLDIDTSYSNLWSLKIQHHHVHLVRYPYKALPCQQDNAMVTNFQSNCTKQSKSSNKSILVSCPLSTMPNKEGLHRLCRLRTPPTNVPTTAASSRAHGFAAGQPEHIDFSLKVSRNASHHQIRKPLPASCALPVREARGKGEGNDKSKSSQDENPQNNDESPQAKSNSNSNSLQSPTDKSKQPPPRK